MLKTMRFKANRLILGAAVLLLLVGAPLAPAVYAGDCTPSTSTCP